MRLQLGATLVEFIVSLLILSITSVAIMMLITETTRRSANPMVITQAASIAQSYMEEIFSLPLTDPTSENASLSSQPESGEVRATFDDMRDFAGWHDNSASDQSGIVVSSLQGYQVDVDITAVTSGAFQGGYKITVTVRFGNSDLTVPLVAYRL